MEKAAYRFIKGIAGEAVCLAIPALTAGFFLFWNLDLIKDLNHNVGNLWYFNSLTKEAHSAGVPVQSLLKEVFSRWTQVPGYFFKGLEQWYVFAVPLSQVWITLLRPFIGYGAKSAILASSIVGFMAVVLTYVSGRVYYGRHAGIFSALYIGTSLIFILTVRNGFVFYAWDSLVGQFLILLFYLAHKNQSKKILYLSALAFSVGWFNGYSMFLIFMPPAMLAYVLYSRRKGDAFIFGLKNYIYASIAAVALFMAYTALYSAYLGEELTEVFLRLHHFFIWRSGSMPAPLFDLSSFAVNLKRGFLILFYKSYFPPSIIASGDNVSPYGHPGIPLLVTVFMIIGMAAMLHSRTMVNRLLLCVLGVSAFFISCMLVFDTRYIMVTLPFICITAGAGTQKAIDLFKGNSAIHTAAAFIILLSASGYSAYKNYDFYFNEFGIHEGYLGRFSGQVQAGNYIAANYRPEETAVVLGDLNTVPEDLFAFSAGDRKYEYSFWNRAEKDLPAWEAKRLRDKKYIVYVFSHGNNFLKVPGYRYGEQEDWSLFKDIHPNVKPEKTVYSRGVPLISVYRITKKETLLSMAELGPSKKSHLFFDSSGVLASLILKGPVKDPEIMLNGNKTVLPLSLSRSERITLTRFEGTIEFTPVFQDESFRNDAFEVSNLRLNDKDKRFLELESDGEGYIIYRIFSPVKIKDIEVETRPRIFNDHDGLNKIEVSYSKDNKGYRRLFESASERTGEWDFHFHRDTYHRIKDIDSQEVYIKISLHGEGGKVQLWSPPPVDPLGKFYMMKFVGDLESGDSIGMFGIGKEVNKIEVGNFDPDASIRFYVRPKG